MRIDVAIVDKKRDVAVAIFEVKTSTSLSGQLYSAHGQLAYYRHKYGTPEALLFLVLPRAAKENLTCQNFFQGSGVEILFGEREKFNSINGKSLSDIVNKIVCA